LKQDRLNKREVETSINRDRHAEEREIRIANLKAVRIL